MSSDVAVRTEVGASRSPRRRGRVLRGIGKTFLTAAVILAAYIVWLLWGTGIYYGAQQDSLREDFGRRVDSAATAPSAPAAPALPGQAYALLQIPDLELDEVVVQGADAVVLRNGPGHYDETADPWDDAGRVGIAGHRTTYGAPFWDLELLEPGDDIRMVTERGTFDYVVRQTRVVLPSAGEVLDPTRRPTLVLTTCHPRFSAAERLIVVADRVA